MPLPSDPINPTIPTAPATPQAPQTAPTPTPATSQAPQPSQPQEQEEITEFSPSPMDLMYMMACYCYINASKIGYQALKELNPNFVIINSLKNPEIMTAVAAGSEEIAQIDKNEQSIETELGTADNPNGAASTPGVPSDNTRVNP